MSTNRFGLDVSYFRNLIDRELNRDLSNFKPDELARVFARASLTADASVMREPEFQPTLPSDGEIDIWLSKTYDNPGVSDIKMVKSALIKFANMQEREGRWTKNFQFL